MKKIIKKYKQKRKLKENEWKENGIIPPLNLKDNLMRKIRKNYLLMLRIGIDGNYRYDIVKPQNKGKMIDINGQHYIFNPKYVLRNKRQAGLIIYFDNNPDPVNPKHQLSYINNNDILMTAGELKAYGLQKIWGDYVNTGSSPLNPEFIKWVLIGGGILAFFVFFV